MSTRPIVTCDACLRGHVGLHPRALRRAQLRQRDRPRQHEPEQSRRGRTRRRTRRPPRPTSQRCRACHVALLAVPGREYGAAAPASRPGPASSGGYSVSDAALRRAASRTGQRGQVRRRRTRPDLQSTRAPRSVDVASSPAAAPSSCSPVDPEPLPAEALVSLRNLEKSYAHGATPHVGAAPHHARHQGRRVRLDHGAVGRGQVDAAAHHRHARQRVDRRLLLRRPAGAPAESRRIARGCTSSTSASSSRAITCSTT